MNLFSYLLSREVQRILNRTVGDTFLNVHSTYSNIKTRLTPVASYVRRELLVQMAHLVGEKTKPT